MPTYKIRGIDVSFPFEAYDCQVVYMEKVIQSLQEGSNALLESPTGTGKTLCLLCATLAWRKSLGEFSRDMSEDKNDIVGSQLSGSQSEQLQSRYPVIIYASRTHSQLKQVIRELKASSYRPKMAILGSREQMCIHDEVGILRGKAQNNACHYLCRKRRCRHHTAVSEYMKKHPDLGNKPFDIEDLVNTGRTNGPCPYYVSRELLKAVDILFVPYNYLIDPGNRRSLSAIRWRNAVLIFDEAHNLEGICADAASFDLPAGYLTTCISEAKQCIDQCITRRVVEKSADKQFDPENYAILRALLLKLEKRISEVEIHSKELGFTRPGAYIYEFLSELNITFKTANMLIDTIDNAAMLLEEGNTPEVGITTKSKGTVCRLEGIKDILNNIFRDGGKDHAKFFRFHVQESQQNTTDSLRGKSSRTLSWWCFNPGLAMQEFLKLGVRSIILTSGTLSPLDSFALELNLEFPIRLENPHVISPNQIWVGVVPSGPSGYQLNSSYRNRDSLEYKQELGNTIVNFSRIVPDGLLVFFPSYYMMDQCIQCWKNMGHASSSDLSTIWSRICKYKQPVIEPKQSSLFPHAIEDYGIKLRDTTTSGAIFFAVCRGKVSEGLDFADQAGRAVVVVGMPFSVRTDPKVRLKREYLDQQALSQRKEKVLTGEQWYVQEAARAVNQAVGRVIRHRHDYGAIIFCDERFAQQNLQCQMSYWLRPYSKCYPKFGDVAFTLTRFFRDNRTQGLLKPKLAENFDSDKVSMRHEETLSESPNTRVTNVENSRKPSASVVSTARSNVYDYLAKIVPANRLTLSKKPNLVLPGSEAQVHLWKKSEYGKRNSTSTQEHDNEVIDLTNDEPFGQQKVDLSITTSVKKPKLLGTSYDAIESDRITSSKKLDIDLRESLSRSITSTLQDQSLSEFSTCRPEGLGSSNKDTEFDQAKTTNCPQSPPKEDKKERRGSAFLLQVQEKLSLAEYKEFVGFMKALKSKTMKIKPVLESIAKLFSGPGRLCLLERFKDFVPTKYLPLYEQLLSSYNTTDDT